MGQWGWELGLNQRKKLRQISDWVNPEQPKQILAGLPSYSWWEPLGSVTNFGLMALVGGMGCKLKPDRWATHTSDIAMTDEHKIYVVDKI